MQPLKLCAPLAARLCKQNAAPCPDTQECSNNGAPGAPTGRICACIPGRLCAAPLAVGDIGLVGIIAPCHVRHPMPVLQLARCSPLEFLPCPAMGAPSAVRLSPAGLHSHWPLFMQQACMPGLLLKPCRRALHVQHTEGTPHAVGREAPGRVPFKRHTATLQFPFPRGIRAHAARGQSIWEAVFISVGFMVGGTLMPVWIV